MQFRLKSKDGKVAEVEARKEGRGWRALCPFHNDTNPSLFIYESGLFKCFGCGASGTLAKEEQEHRKLTLEEFSIAKQLPVDFLEQNFVREYENGIIFFYLNEEKDKSKAIYRYRHSLNGANRFSWERGANPMPYGLWKLKEFNKNEPLIIVEGESDALTLWYCKFQAIGIPGVHAWKPEFLKFIKDFKRVFVLVEPDSNGALYNAVKKNLRCVPLSFKHVGFKDASEAYIALGKEEFTNLINGMIEEEEAKTPRIIPVKDVEARKTEWVIPCWFAKGVINLIAGEPGVGKTTLILNLLACASTGKGKVPIGDEFITVSSCKTLYLSLEDDLSCKVKPTLDALGVGDCENIYLSYAEGKSELNEISKEFKFFDIVVIDPLTNLITEDVNKINEVLKLLKPFKILAKKHNTAIVVVWHLNKQKGILGSVGFQSLAKTILLIGKTDVGLTITQKKNAFSSPLPSLKLRIDGGNISWLGVSDIDVGEALNERDSIIREFLLTLAEEKDKWSFSEIAERAKKEGLNVDSVRVIGQRLTQKGLMEKRRIYRDGKIATSTWVFLRNRAEGVSKAQIIENTGFDLKKQSSKNIPEQQTEVKFPLNFNKLEEQTKDTSKNCETVSKAQTLDNSQFILKKQGNNCFLRKGIIGDPYVESEIKKFDEVKTPKLDKFLSFLHFTAQKRQSELGLLDGDEAIDLSWAN